jgi:ABC-2 type transport system ATP-binding protein
MAAMIEVRGVTKRYRDRVAVDSLTFSVERGELLGFLGANGAGKSTTMKILTGCIPPSEGSASIDGFDVFEKPLEVKRRIGYLPEVPPLHPEMTVVGFLKFVARLKGLPGKGIKAEVERVCALTGITAVADRLIHNLSKGFRQRVGIAQALLGTPPVLILDEPTEGLDPIQRGEILSMLKGLAGKQTVILSTHILSEVKAICDKVLLIRQGKIAWHDRIDGADLEQLFLQHTAA